MRGTYCSTVQWAQIPLAEQRDPRDIDPKTVPFAQKVLHAVPFPTGSNIGLQFSRGVLELLSNYSYSRGRGTERP